MSKHLHDPRRSPAASGMETLQHERPARGGLFDKEAIDIELMIVFGIRDCRLQHLFYVARYTAPGKGQLRQCRRSSFSADGLRDEVELARARTETPHNRGSLVLIEPARGCLLAHISPSSPSCHRRGRKTSGSVRTHPACARSCSR